MVDARAGRRAARFAAGCFVASIGASLALAVVYWSGGQPQAEGVLLGVALGGVGLGMVAWAKRFLPGADETEARDAAAFRADFDQAEAAIARRGLLVRLLVGALSALGLAVLFPIRSLGPRPGRGLFQTAYAPGVRVVTAGGEPLRPGDVVVGAVLTVWPAGHVGAADSPTLVIRVEDADLFEDDVVVDWTVGGIVAYSKLCTHTGCPVGLYQADAHLLLCPCHQSTFDVLRGAEPTFGPATRPLPQLPLGVDAEGFIVATGDFPTAVGGGFWDRPA